MSPNLPSSDSFDMTLAWSLGAAPLGAPTTDPTPSTDLGADLDQSSSNRGFWSASFR